MIEFEFTEEQEEIRESVRAFSKKEILPLIEEIDKKERIPEKIIKGLSELGILGMTVSNEYGGVEADPITVGLVAEELASADITCAIPTFFLVQCAWGYVLNRYGNKSLKEKVLPYVTKGDAFIGIAATEPDAGSDLSNIKTYAEKRDGKFIINGEKMFISGINEIVNILPMGGGYVTVVKTEKNLGVKGISLIYVSVKNTKGITPTILTDWGRKGISTGGFSMENVEIPEENLIGKEGKGFYLAMEGFDYARGIISIVCSAVAMSSLKYAMDYLKIRKAFGNPIGKYEGIQFKLAEHWAKLQAVRLSGYRALWMLSKEQKGFGKRLETTKACAEAKMLAPVFAFEAINDAIQWFGAFGYTEECPLHLALKGVRSYFWAEGTIEIMKIIVGRELLGKEFVAYR